MTKEYRIRVRGKQRAHIDIDLVTQLVVMLGRELAQEAQDRETRKRSREMSEPGERTGAAG
jgi:hypothetical protein